MDIGRPGRIFPSFCFSGLIAIISVIDKFSTKLFVALVLSFSTYVHAVDPRLDWKTIESENFYIHFAVDHQSSAQRVAAIAESVHQRLSTELNWQPAEKTHLVLSDESDLANGYATPIHINRSVLFMVPPSGVGGLEDFDDWLTTLITHEYTHVLHLDKAHGVPAGLRDIFGRFFLLFPNVYEPTWITEGLATLKETDMHRGIGRGQSSLYAAMMRAESMQGLKPVSQVNLPISTWPGGTTRYLYGVYFMLFIEDAFGEEKIQQLVEAYSDNLLPFAINSTFQTIFEKDVSQMWALFETWLEKRFAPQVESIKKAGLRQGEALTVSGYSNQPVRASGDYVYYVRNAGNHQPELVRFRTGNEKNIEILTDVHQGTDFDPGTGTEVLLSQVEICDEYGLYRDLYIYDTEKDALNRLTECGRYLRAIWSARDTIIALHHRAGSFELHELGKKGDLIRVLWQSSNGEIVSQFDESPDGNRLVAAVWRRNNGWNLELFDTASGKWQSLTSDTSIQAYPSFEENGNSIVYSADYDGVFNLYRFDLDTGAHQKISNVIDGAFQSSMAPAGRDLYYVGYSAMGTDIYRLDETEAITEITPEQDKKLETYDYQASELEARDYGPASSLKPRWWFPHLVLVEDGNEVGLSTAGNDALGIHNYLLTAAYELDSRMPVGSFVYSYSNRFSIIAARENNILRDTAGNFDRTRPTDTLQAVLAFPYTRVLSSHNFLLAIGWERDSDRVLAPTAVPARDFEDNLLGLGWLYNSSRRYPLSISDNDGSRIRIVAEDSETLGSDFTGQVYTLDWKQYIRTGEESVLALRFVQGWGTEMPSQFELGGENTGVSLSLLGQSGVPVFGLRDYALRGYAEGLPQLRGRRAQLLSAEWRFPGQRIERGVMVPPVGLMQWSGAVFIESGDAYNQDSADEYYTGAGVEFNADLNLFYLMPVTARLGFAHGFDENIGDDRVYLSIGASF